MFFYVVIQSRIILPLRLPTFQMGLITLVYPYLSAHCVIITKLWHCATVAFLYVCVCMHMSMCSIAVFRIPDLSEASFVTFDTLEQML